VTTVLSGVAIEGVPEKTGLGGGFFNVEKRREGFAAIGAFQCESTARGGIQGMGAGGGGMAVTRTEIIVVPLQEAGIELFPG